MGSPVMFVGGSGIWLLLNAGANAQILGSCWGSPTTASACDPETPNAPL